MPDRCVMVHDVLQVLVLVDTDLLRAEPQVRLRLRELQDMRRCKRRRLQMNSRLADEVVPDAC